MHVNVETLPGAMIDRKRLALMLRNLRSHGTLEILPSFGFSAPCFALKDAAWKENAVQPP